MEQSNRTFSVGAANDEMNNPDKTEGCWFSQLNKLTLN